jgi:hypothetical protein
MNELLLEKLKTSVYEVFDKKFRLHKCLSCGKITTFDNESKPIFCPYCGQKFCDMTLFELKKQIASLKEEAAYMMNSTLEDEDSEFKKDFTALSIIELFFKEITDETI